jgi:hypothetical protein
MFIALYILRTISLLLSTHSVLYKPRKIEPQLAFAANLLPFRCAIPSATTKQSLMSTEEGQRPFIPIPELLAQECVCNILRVKHKSKKDLIVLATSTTLKDALSVCC